MQNNLENNINITFFLEEGIVESNVNFNYKRTTFNRRVISIDDALLLAVNI